MGRYKKGYGRAYTEPEEWAKLPPEARVIREYLDETGQNAAELARVVGISKQAIYPLIDGKTAPRGDTLSLLADRLNLPLDYLKGRTDCRQTNADMQAVCQFSGASDAVIDAYRAAREADKKSGGKEPSRIEALNAVLPAIIGLAVDLAEYLRVAQAARMMLKHKPKTPKLDALSRVPAGASPFDPVENPPAEGRLDAGVPEREMETLELFNAEYLPVYQKARAIRHDILDKFNSLLVEKGGF